MTNLDYLTSSQVADALSVPVRTVTRWAKDGHLKPAAKLPGLRGAYLFTPAEVERAKAEAAA